MLATKEKKVEDLIDWKSRNISGLTIVKGRNGLLVKTNTGPVDKRHYHGNAIDHKKLKLWDAKKKKYMNVEHLQPVLYDLDNPMPAYSPRWEVWRGTGKTGTLERVDFPPYYKNWWKEQVKRCILGYEVGGVRITGQMYFFLNFWKIKGKRIGSGFITPRFYDVHKEIFDRVEKAGEAGKNIMFLKRRQIGCSEIFSSICAWMYTFFPGSESLVIGGEGAYAENTFRKTREGLDEFSRNSDSKAADAFFKRRVKDTVDEIKSGFSQNGQRLGFSSRILSITVKDNVQRASGKSPHFVLMEESGRNRFLKIVSAMIQHSLEEGGMQDGRMMAYIGTGGEMDKGVEDMMDMYYDPVKFNILPTENTFDLDAEGTLCADFLPCWKYFVTDHDGNSYEEQGMIIVDEILERLKGDLEALHTYRTQMPKTPQDAFASSGLSPFDSAKLTEARKNIQVHKLDRLAKYGRLDWVTDSGGKKIGVKWTAADRLDRLDADGDLMYPFVIFEHPERPNRETESGNVDELKEYVVYFSDDRYLNLYTGGTDPYDKEDAPTSSSLGSTSIFKGMREDALTTSTSMLFAARLTWRPCKPEKFYEATAMLCMYYGAKNLVEYSNVGILSWYKTNHFEHLLKERPLFVQSMFKDSKVTNKYGVDPQAKPYMINSYKSYIADYSQNMIDLIQVQRALAYRRAKQGQKFNDDITDGAMLAYQHYLDNKDRRLKIVSRNNRKKNDRPFFGVVRLPDGRMVKAS